MLKVVTVADDPSLVERMAALTDRAWPPFVTESSYAGDLPTKPHWMGIYTRWPHLQFALIDDDSGEMLACGNALAFAWDGDADELPDTGWDWAMSQAQEDFAARRTPRTMCALSITVEPACRQKGLSSRIVEEMRRIGRAAGFQRLLAPVRPTLKSRYPITPIETYIAWTNGKGLPFDPWLRVHARLGAQLISACTRSMSFKGTIRQWEEWSGLRFPTSGLYTVEGALVPVRIYREADMGLYIEPNVWMVHGTEA